MVLTPPMEFTQTDGIVSVLLDHTHTRGPSCARIRGDRYHHLNYKSENLASEPNSNS